MLSATQGDASKQGTYPYKWIVGKIDLWVKGNSAAMAASAAKNLSTHRKATILLFPVEPSVMALAAASTNTAKEIYRCNAAS